MFSFWFLCFGIGVAAVVGLCRGWQIRRSGLASDYLDCFDYVTPALALVMVILGIAAGISLGLCLGGGWWWSIWWAPIAYCVLTSLTVYMVVGWPSKGAHSEDVIMLLSMLVGWPIALCLFVVAAWEDRSEPGGCTDAD